MSTLHQLVSRNVKFSKRVRPLVPALQKCPQKRGVIQKTIIETPKKPNSAKRKAAKVKLSNGRIIKCYIPGIGHRLSKHSVIMVRGGRAQDLIGVRYKAVFGKFDFFAPSGRVSRLSKFGLSSKQQKSVKNKQRYQYENKLLKHIRHIAKYKLKVSDTDEKKIPSYNEEYYYDDSEYSDVKTVNNASFFFRSSNIMDKKLLTDYNNKLNTGISDTNYSRYNQFFNFYNDPILGQDKKKPEIESLIHAENILFVQNQSSNIKLSLFTNHDHILVNLK